MKVGSNLYAYVNNNPENYVDSDGRNPALVIAAAALAAYGAGKIIGGAGADIIAWYDLYNQSQIYQKARQQAICHYGGPSGDESDLPPAVRRLMCRLTLPLNIGERDSERR